MKVSAFKLDPRLKIAFLAILSLVLVFLSYSIFVEPRSISVTRLNIEGAPPKVVFLADLHIRDSNAEYMQSVVEKVNSLDPDIVLISGDFILDNAEDLDHISILSQLKGRKYAVLGNHDYFSSINLAGSRMKVGEKAEANFTVQGYNVSSMDDGLYSPQMADEVKQRLEEAGFRVLKNEYEILDLNGRKTLILGLDDCWAGKTHLPPNLPEANYSIYLLHEPECIADWDYDLMLTGHTHGGQIVFPIIGAPQSYIGMYSFSGMLVDEAGKKSYVTRGVGSYPMFFGIADMRFNCPPEIVLING
ncbi:MAG: metallophosphoesterase [Candidatus Micrarchaeota archaeon]|nr:metallophosphoesterase [Candidatus Micrarchaeota archaeon]